MEGGHDGHCELPRGRPPAVHGCPKRGHSGPFTRRPGNCYYHRVRPGPPPPGRVGHLVTAGTNHIAGGWRQGKEKQQSCTLVPSQALVAGSQWWLGVTGLTNRNGFVEDGSQGQVYSGLRTSHMLHWRWRQGGARLGFEPSPLVKADREEELVQGPGKTLSFPYLQLVHPHCHTCQC